ncbi:4-phosphoerythronate dehydrogenase [Candidatus Pantoea edessiphila]|uniref:Erythronate-4-phosphate dehydrogenase n=1 Tax=Candidatus Pantoea edessiphila TaxID=2044610 RepID=A0A2P5SWM3_9GAMM|nr:4-phosphoerythronate dehydrogenase [Candidatus Pantoea edessiphila]PPI86710.1 4-phosphoerythronate dehydrogenase [Candidatus Pantoea edessiphila]
MKILADEAIPYVYELFKNTGNIFQVPHTQILGKEIIDTECLIIRSVTKINKNLIKGSLVKFIGTATSGIDHIDQEWLKKSGIFFSSAPGCNAIAVAEYVFSALLFLAENNNFQIKDRIVGIIGVGNIGSYLNKIFKAWGIKTLLCDPPRFDCGANDKFYSLTQIIKLADIITLHTPLLYEGKYKTLHMINKNLLLSLKPNTILINSSRGPIINNKELLEVLHLRKDIKVVMDVWEKEPKLSSRLLNKISIGTAHIAGHTLEGKMRAIIKLYQEWCKIVNKPQKTKLNKLLPMPIFNNIYLHGKVNQSVLKNLVYLIYDIHIDDSLLRNAIISKSFSFEKLRNNYRQRREWYSLKVVCDNYKSHKILKGIGFNAILKLNY